MLSRNFCVNPDHAHAIVPIFWQTPHVWPRTYKGDPRTMLAMNLTDENVSRRHAQVHRAQGQSVITIGKLSIELDAKTVEVDGRRIHVTGSEYHMLELLALRRGTCVTRGAFIDYLYGTTNAPKPKILDIFICKLKRNLSGAADVDKCIETVWGRGYLLNDRVREGAARIWAPKTVVEHLGSGRP